MPYLEEKSIFMSKKEEKHRVDLKRMISFSFSFFFLVESKFGSDVHEKLNFRMEFPCKKLFSIHS